MDRPSPRCHSAVRVPPNPFLDAVPEQTLQGLAGSDYPILAAVEATKTRNKAYSALADWLQHFRPVATAALRSDPEKLKILEG